MMSEPDMERLMNRIIQAALDRGADFADLRITDATATAISVEDGRADSISSARKRGAGLRVLVDGAWGFAPTNQPAEAEMLRCVGDAIEMAHSAAPYVTDPGMVAEIEPARGEAGKPPRIRPDSVPLKDRVQRVFELERAAREAAPEKIANTTAGYSDSSGEMFLANSFGTFLHYGGTGTSIGVQVVATDGETRQRAVQRRANRSGYELVADLDIEALGKETAEKAVSLLTAERAPAGTFDVIIDQRICGLLVHEAFGHNSEADAVWTGDSILAGKLGEQVAAETVTIVDDPTLPGHNGSFEYDHEGVPAQRHVIVENGILKGYLHSLETAARFGVAPGGSARAEGHQSQPIVRMSNTAIEPGETSLEDMMSELDKGLYLTGGYWGYVFTGQGQFTCNVEHAYAIENGKLGRHYRNVCISGRTLETLQKVTAVGNDQQFELGGTCGKGGQGMPVDAGGPHLRISQVVVGGQSVG
jgi:TldD protein